MVNPVERWKTHIVNRRVDTNQCNSLMLFSFCSLSHWSHSVCPSAKSVILRLAVTGTSGKLLSAREVVRKALMDLRREPCRR